MLAREVLNGACEVVVELLELEPKCQALELTLELAPGGHLRRRCWSIVSALVDDGGRRVTDHGIEGRDVGRLGQLYVRVSRHFGLGAKVGAGRDSGQVVVAAQHRRGGVVGGGEVGRRLGEVSEDAAGGVVPDGRRRKRLLQSALHFSILMLYSGAKRDEYRWATFNQVYAAT